MNGCAKGAELHDMFKRKIERSMTAMSASRMKLLGRKTMIVERYVEKPSGCRRILAQIQFFMHELVSHKLCPSTAFP